MKGDSFPRTPDGRYMVVRGRLWRPSNPGLLEDARQDLVSELMNSRRAVRDAGEDGEGKAEARGKVDAAKVALGEREPSGGKMALRISIESWQKIRPIVIGSQHSPPLDVPVITPASQVVSRKSASRTSWNQFSNFTFL